MAYMSFECTRRNSHVKKTLINFSKVLIEINQNKKIFSNII